MVVPESRILKMVSKMCSRDCGSTPTVGSSSSRNRGWCSRPGRHVDAALHAAGELVDAAVAPVPELDQIQQLPAAGIQLARR